LLFFVFFLFFRFFLFFLFFLFFTSQLGITFLNATASPSMVQCVLSLAENLRVATGRQQSVLLDYLLQWPMHGQRLLLVKFSWLPILLVVEHWRRLLPVNISKVSV
jgi:hypothetical protein